MALGFYSLTCGDIHNPCRCRAVLYIHSPFESPALASLTDAPGDDYQMKGLGCLRIASWLPKGLASWLPKGHQGSGVKGGGMSGSKICL